MAVGPRAGANPDRFLRDIAAAVAASNLSLASEIATTALNQGLQHPVLHNARALWAQQQGNIQDALNEFQRARAFTPRDPTLLSAIGMCLVRLNRAQEAISVFDAAIASRPALAQTHYRKGWAYESTGDRNAAKRCYERAVTLQPNYSEALSGLAVIAARNGEGAKARALAARSLKHDPGEPTAAIALGIADIAERNFSAAEERLRTALADPRAVGHTKAVILGFLADALDGQDRAPEAFAAYAERNDLQRALHESRFPPPQRASHIIDELIAYFEKTDAGLWHVRGDEPPHADAPREHVFLLGFLRSGTTLLEQVLGANPQIESLEERDTFGDISQTYLSGAAALDRLSGLEGDALNHARASYWKQVAAFGADVRGKVFVDKQPLNTFNLPLIARLFPKAKIIFALRDPRDVVFSCFRRHFEINATTFELLKLEDAAEFYASVMRLAQLYRGKLPLHLFEHRYEDMVEDFDGRVQAVCDFIGLEWTEAMRDFAKSARDSEIRSPSAAQVRRPLYGHGIGQWRRYANQLAPITPALAPWIEAFGYAA